MNRLKIAQVATADVSIRFLLLDHIQALAAMGHDVTAVCAPGRWVEDLRARGVQVHTLAMSREADIGADLRCLLELRRYFKREGFDVVHSHTPKAGLLAPLAARMAGVPAVVHTIHGLLFHDRMPLWRRSLFWVPEKITATFSHFLLSQSREDMGVARQTRLCSQDKISYIGNGIEVTRFCPERVGSQRDRLLCQLGFDHDDIVVGAVGRLVYEKGFGELFAALERLTCVNKKLKLVVIGPQEPDQNDAVDAARIASLQHNHAVRFLDWCDDMPAWYSMMDIFAAPSHREGIPRACMEAAAMGVPVIASDIRGCREVVRDGETGLLVPVKDPRALADAILILASNRTLRRRMGENGRRHIAESFSNHIVLERLRDFYSALGSRLQREGNEKRPDRRS